MASPHPTLLCIFDIKFICGIQVTLTNIATHCSHLVVGDDNVDVDDDEGYDGNCDG